MTIAPAGSDSPTSVWIELPPIRPPRKAAPISPDGQRTTPATRHCAECYLPRRSLHRSGICRGYRASVQEACAELGPDASPEHVAALKQVAEDRGHRRLTARALT